MNAFFSHDEALERGSSEGLEALREFQNAEAAMRQRTLDAMGLTDNELHAVRVVLGRSDEDRPVKPMDVTLALGISSASTTAILDRLESSGHLRRVPHPSDRRSVLLQPTEHARSEVGDTLRALDERLAETARSFGPGDTEVIVQFFSRMRAAMDDSMRGGR